jgi:hypothetical protein
VRCFYSSQSVLRANRPLLSSELNYDSGFLGVTPPLRMSANDPKFAMNVLEVVENARRTFPTRFGMVAPAYPGYSAQSDFPIRSIDPIISDWSMLKSWIQGCDTDHDECHAILPTTPFAIKLIDCNTGLIVDADTSCRYVALSYVWGQSHDIGDANHDTPDAVPCGKPTLPTELPRTILDAITATIELGYTYLWCDQFCVDQRNASELHTQIGSMDLIYRNAQFTIIAASGKDASFGISGVSETPRLACPEIIVGNRKLTYALPNPTHLLSKSKWASRGWTYQEALLSRRRLIFTDQGVYFECQTTRYCEALDWRPTSLAALDRNLTAIRPSDLIKIPTDHLNRWTIYDRIFEYSKRDLSFDSDALNGFLGILKIYQSISPPLHHICGIPLLHYAAHDPPSKRLTRGMMWSLGTPGNRRTQFPSWSWAGWTGEVLYNDKTPMSFSEVEFRVETRDGQEITIDEHWVELVSLINDPRKILRHLRLSSWTLPFDIVSRPDFILPNPRYTNSHYAKLRIDSSLGDLCAYIQVELLQHHDAIGTLSNASCIMFPQGSTYDYNYDPSSAPTEADSIAMRCSATRVSAMGLPMMLPVVQLKDGIAERIGTLRFRRMYLHDHTRVPSSAEEAEATPLPLSWEDIPPSITPCEDIHLSANPMHRYHKEGITFTLKLQSAFMTIGLG